MNKKRILIMAAHFHPYKGGLENFALELGSKLASKGISVDVLTFQEKGLQEKEKYFGLRIIRIPGWQILGNTYTLPVFNKKYKDTINKVLSNNYDVVITNTRFFTTSWLGMKYSRKLKKKNPKTKFIHIEHGNVHVIHKNPVVTFLAWIYDQTIGRIIFRSADIVVGISKQCTDFASKFGAKKTILIHNSINASDFVRKKTDLRKKLKIGDEDFVIINGIGRLIYAKGLHDVFEAVKYIKGVTIITIGDGPYKEKLIEIAKKTGVKSIFTGTLGKKEIVEYLSMADLFINPSYSEGLPTCVLEAGAAGIPVIATNVGGTSEIIGSEKEGFLYKPKNVSELKKKIIQLKEDKKKREELGKNIQKKINAEFDWNKNIKKFEEIIK